MQREIRWNLRDGREAKITIELITSREIDADGPKVAVDVCERRVRVDVDGLVMGYDIERIEPQVVGWPIARIVAGRVYGSRMYITADIMERYEAAVAEIEATPEWQAKVERERKEYAANAEYEAHAAWMRRACSEDMDV